MVNTKTSVSLNTEAMISLQLESPSVASYQYNVTTALYYYSGPGEYKRPESPKYPAMAVAQSPPSLIRRVRRRTHYKEQITAAASRTKHL